MIVIDCPNCGPRNETEYHYGGQAHVAYPEDPAALSDEEWGRYLFYRENPKGLFAERWVHSAGCRKWFNVVRDTATYRIHAIYRPGDPRPDLPGAPHRPRPAADPPPSSDHLRLARGHLRIQHALTEERTTMSTFNRRRLLAAGVAAAAALSLAACSVTTGTPGSGSGSASARQPKDHYRVAYIARAQTDSFAAWLANEMKKEATTNYKDITLEVFDGQADDEVENKMIENAVANKFDAIIVQSNNADAQAPYIQQAIDAGIVTITTNPRVQGLKGGNSIDANPYDQGGIVAKLAVDKIPQNANVVVLDGPPGNFHGDNRRKAWKELFFDKRTDVKIVAEDTAHWNKDEALKLMEDWSLSNSKIDAIVSMNDNMASGALEAVKSKANFKGIQAYGVDGTPEAALLIKDGTMTATALQNAQELAQLNMKAVHDLLSGAKTEVNDNVGNPLITADNAQEYIDLYKKAGLIKS